MFIALFIRRFRYKIYFRHVLLYISFVISIENSNKKDFVFKNSKTHSYHNYSFFIQEQDSKIIRCMYKEHMNGAILRVSSSNKENSSPLHLAPQAILRFNAPIINSLILYTMSSSVGSFFKSCCSCTKNISLNLSEKSP